MGRPKKWIPALFSVSDRIAGKVLRAKYGPDLRTENRVKEDFARLCRVNHCTPEDAYLPWLGQMKNKGLSAGTIKDYVHMVIKGRRSTAAYEVRRTAESYQTDSPVGHAADTGLDHVQGLVKKCDPGIRAHMWLMLATGARCTDISRLRKRCFKKLTKKSMTILFAWTKGIKKVRHRREVSYPLDGLMEMPPSVRHKLNAARDDDNPFVFSTNEVNKALREAGGAGERTTSGTFRRLFSKRITKYCETNNISKKSMMLHVTDDMDAAFYAVDNNN